TPSKLPRGVQSHAEVCSDFTRHWPCTSAARSNRVNGDARSGRPEDHVGDIRTDAAITAALGRQMTRAVQRQAVAAGNLANLDTPGFRTKELRFDEALDAELGGSLVATNARHFGQVEG